MTRPFNSPTPYPPPGARYYGLGTELGDEPVPVSAWAVVSIAVGVGALVLAFIPFYVSVLGAVLGLGGVATGIVGLLRRGRGTPAPAITGIATSAIAAVVGVVMVFVHTESAAAPPPAPAQQSAQASEDRSNTETVLSKELDVTVGKYEPTGSDSGPGRLPVTLTNRLTAARTFSVLIVAFDGTDQLASDTVGATLNAGEQKVETAFSRTKPEFQYGRLKNATFRVLTAFSIPPR
ncbi:hypothetical protein A5784_15120 [Mycobacterium sp. 852013-50091_SCH5140682]|uniref:hypothetical protein n=1 Tax=Mycobacterium sp. 852013-50091_SCH5140682 TaxID=1834109 RepID=UPI000801C3C3|nr:hypothetical protein [Mycobacterium sp. 852013-50091_SCH5140682]OBC03231.1 hypothetical protein A5784_15120 [Mycobacterium sp. 852013-50091_SCH5140682]